MMSHRYLKEAGGGALCYICRRIVAKCEISSLARRSSARDGGILSQNSRRSRQLLWQKKMSASANGGGDDKYRRNRACRRPAAGEANRRCILAVWPGESAFIALMCRSPRMRISGEQNHPRATSARIRRGARGRRPASQAAVIRGIGGGISARAQCRPGGMSPWKLYRCASGRMRAAHAGIIDAIKLPRR